MRGIGILKLIRTFLGIQVANCRNGEGGNSKKMIEFFSVVDRFTGKKLMDCGSEKTACEVVALDPHRRRLQRNQFLTGPVVDVTVVKALPTPKLEGVSVPDPEPKLLNEDTRPEMFG